MPNTTYLQLEMDWFTSEVQKRFEAHFELPTSTALTPVPMPDEFAFEEPYPRFVRDLRLGREARLVLIMALLPILRPAALDMFKVTDATKIAITDFGGYALHAHKGFIPTVETALFLVAGGDLDLRIAFLQFFQQDNLLFGQYWLKMEAVGVHEPFTSALLLPSRDLIDLVTLGHLGEPEFGATFPAERIATTRTWDELVLPPETRLHIDDILNWIKHERLVMEEWKLGAKVSPGFRALFHGPPGTGKTFTASLLGQATGKDVYRIDLSMIVSKYIGETEKNLKIVFDKAQSRGWILFFDEADALFGKRTDVSDSKDRYANQEVSYLLQRVESFDGIVLLATNYRDNMDKAFTRRFQAVVHFPMPGAAERLHLWQTAIPVAMQFSAEINLPVVAERFELSGGSIVNALRHCALQAAVRGLPVVMHDDMMEAIRREYRKSGKIMG
jgi:hypothetical protein